MKRVPRTRFLGLRKIIHRSSLSREDFVKSNVIREASTLPHFVALCKFWMIRFKFGGPR